MKATDVIYDGQYRNRIFLRYLIRTFVFVRTS